MFKEPPRNEFILLPLKRINIPSKYFTIGIQERKEEELQITSGSLNVMSLIGEEDMSILFLALAMARTSVVQMDSDGARNMVIVYPETLSFLKQLQKYFDYFMGSFGNEKFLNISWNPVSNVQEILPFVERLNRGDIFLDPYSDAFLDTPRISNAYMDCLKENKSDKFILIARFSRKKLVITKQCDNELIVESKKTRFGIALDPLNINMDMMNYNPSIGSFKINGKDGRRIDYSLYYPFYIK